ERLPAAREDGRLVPDREHPERVAAQADRARSRTAGYGPAGRHPARDDTACRRPEMSTAPALEQATRAVPWGDARTLGEVRPAVRELLESSKAFADMTPDEREQLARETVKVATYMANPEGLAREDIEGGGLAEAQADATEEAKKRAASSPGFASKDFQAGAVKQGVEQFGQLVQKVDFPAFVAGLIKGVFQAIVDSSIQQMRAYGELIANVAKTVDQYAQDNISENNARDFLAQKYPDGFGVTVDEGSTAFAEGDP